MGVNPAISRSGRGLRSAALAAVAIVATAFGLSMGGAPTQGPDVTVLDLNGVVHWGGAGGIQVYSVGSTACNVGDQPVAWCDEAAGCGAGTTSADHPVIAQGLYRLKDGRFEQLGIGWLKHSFASGNDPDPACGGGTCVGPPLGGHQLGVGCVDPYIASQNGARPLGMRSEVDATTGAYPFPYTVVPSPQLVDQRIQVPEAAVAPASNPGALFFLEAHYVAPDDAAAGNGLNNASYRRVTVAPNFAANLAAPTVRERPAVFAWRAEDPAVEIVTVDVPGAIVQRFHVARKVTDLGGGDFHYEYAIHNLNSDRSARAFAVEFPAPATIAGVGFKDVDHHSGEPYSTADWTPAVGPAGVSWSTDTFATDPNANALRWGTLFNFRFDADRGPALLQHTLTLFKPGTPGEIVFGEIFGDGFESGDTSAWSAAVP